MFAWKVILRRPDHERVRESLKVAHRTNADSFNPAFLTQGARSDASQCAATVNLR